MLVEIKNFLDKKTVFIKTKNASNNLKILEYSYITEFDDYIEIKAKEMNNKSIEIYLFETVVGINEEPFIITSSDDFIKWFNRKFWMFLS